MSLSGSSLSRCSNWAMTRLAMVSSIGVPRKMMRSLSSLEKMSKERSPRLVCSMTIGTRLAWAMGSSGGAGAWVHPPGLAGGGSRRRVPRLPPIAQEDPVWPCALRHGRLDGETRWGRVGSIDIGSFARDLHPMVVHSPVALMLTGLAFEVVAAVRGHAGLARVALLLIVLGFAAALMAVVTGLTNPEVRAVQHTLSVTPPTEPGTRALFLQRLDRIRVHQRLAYGVLITGALALLVRLWRTRGALWTAASVVSGAALAAAAPASSGAPAGVGSGQPDLRIVGRSLTAVGERYDLARERVSCALCHTRLAADPFELTSYGRDYRELLFRDNPGARSILDASFAEIRTAVAATSRTGLDSDGDGYDNDLELRFGSLPGDAASHPSVPVQVLERYRRILVARERDGSLEELRLAGAGRLPDCADSDGDGVVDCLETLFGFDPASGSSVPAARGGRLALYRAALARAGVAAAR